MVNYLFKKRISVVSKAKLYLKLDTLEAQLLELLVPHLENAINGNNDFIFCVKPFNKTRELKNSTDELTEELIEMGAQVLALREKLGEPSIGSPAERICWYCRQWSDVDKHSRLSTPGLAKQFLSEMAD